MTRLLAIKRFEKENPSAINGRDKLISDFEKREGWVSNPQVDRLIIDTTKEMEYNKVGEKNMENRLRALGDKPIIPLTKEENFWERMEELEKGGKRKTRKNRKSKTKRRKIKGSKKMRKPRKSLRKRKL